jgi:hypothetical protein
MRINKWSATVAAVAILLAGGASADPRSGEESAEPTARMQKAARTADGKAREEAKKHERELEDEAGEGKRVTDQEERAEREGAEISSEMRERREERKEIKEEYREARKAGEIDKAKKKPWWKFWGSDDGSVDPDS